VEHEPRLGNDHQHPGDHLDRAPMKPQQLPAWPMEGRAETGVIQFGDDWPGIFIRGDNALSFAFMIREAMPEFRDAALYGLLELLESCAVHQVNGQLGTST
jgi:hypothetical protein